MRKKRLQRILDRSVMSQYMEAKTRVSVDSELPEEFDVKVMMHQGSVMSPFLLAFVVYVVTELARLRSMFINKISMFINVAFECKGLKVNLWKIKVMVSGGITKDGLSKGIVCTFGVYRLRVKANSILCVQYGMWIHGRCARVKG